MHDGNDKDSGDDSDNDDAKNAYLQSFYEDYELARVNFQELFDKGFSLCYHIKSWLVKHM